MKLEAHNIELLENEPLARYTAWRIGGPARYFAAAQTAEAMRALLQWSADQAMPVFILGGGSNILIADGGFPGLVIRNRAVQQRIEAHGDDVRLWIEAGAPTAGTARKLAAQGYGGLVWAEGLPGTIGGAIYGNAGCYGSEINAHLIRAWVLRNGEIEEWPRDRFDHGYRTSVLKQAQTHRSPQAQDDTIFVQPGPAVILAAELQLSRDDPAKLAAEMAAIAEARKGKTPSGSSCGSVFKNPPATTAGTLLDQAGLKGATTGGARVSEKHANYIVNRGDATASDVLKLAEVMRERVLHVFGVELELEVQVVGDQP